MKPSNPEKHGIDDSAEKRKLLLENAKLIKDRFEGPHIEYIIGLLKKGYKVTKFQEFQGGSYATEFTSPGNKVTLIKEKYPWPFVVGAIESSPSQEALGGAKVQKEPGILKKFEILLEELKGEKKD